MMQFSGLLSFTRFLLVVKPIILTPMYEWLLAVMNRLPNHSIQNLEELLLDKWVKIGA